jgi:hypothetical protein
VEADSPVRRPGEPRRGHDPAHGLRPLRRKPKELTEDPTLLDVSHGGGGMVLNGGEPRVRSGARSPRPGSGRPAATDEQGTLTGVFDSTAAPDPEALRRARTAAATAGALAAELARDNLAVIAFWSDAAVLSRLGQRVAPQALVESMVAIPARGLTNLAFPLQAARRELARVPARDARVLLLSDCVHNAGPDPRPFAARLPRLDLLLDTTGEQDPDLARDLARLGRGQVRHVRTYRDVAPALSEFFAS